MVCSETIRLSRPNSATNHGSPAAGTNTMWSGPCMGSRSAAMSCTPDYSSDKTPRCWCGSSAPCAATLPCCVRGATRRGRRRIPAAPGNAARHPPGRRSGSDASSARPSARCRSSASVRVHRRRAVAPSGVDDDLAAEILVAIGQRNVCRLGDQDGGDAAPPHDVVALHLEDVGEIGSGSRFPG